jgi:hypothetical protein
VTANQPTVVGDDGVFFIARKDCGDRLAGAFVRRPLELDFRFGDRSGSGFILWINVVFRILRAALVRAAN